MTPLVLVVLSFIIFRAEDGRAWEEGTVTARTCEEARAIVATGLQPGQQVSFGDCVPR